MRYERELQIGRQIEAQLRRSGMQPPRGGEFSTNQALFSMTAELGGWATTTALVFFGTPLAGDLVTAHPLPFAPFSRLLALHARPGALRDLPHQMADEMRASLQDRIVGAGASRLPFLLDGFQILR